MTNPDPLFDSAGTGYLHAGYAASLAEFGKPKRLEGCQGWILKRPIGDTGYTDAMGCYPIFSCRSWPALHDSLTAIEGELVSVSLVTDPFGAYDEAYLHRCFPDVMRAFKLHFIADLNVPVNDFVADHHRRNAGKALRRLVIEKCDAPSMYLDDWVSLYANLVARHHIKGLVAFSKASFASQLNVPGIVAFRAVADETTVGMLLWYVTEGVGYYHLGAHSELGYELLSSFALFWRSFEYFAANGVRRLDLGAGAGITADANDGLSRFKKGWSNGVRPAYLCGRILNTDHYDRIVKQLNTQPTAYFPAYRSGEFGRERAGS